MAQKHVLAAVHRLGAGDIALWEWQAWSWKQTTALLPQQ